MRPNSVVTSRMLLLLALGLGVAVVAVTLVFVFKPSPSRPPHWPAIVTRQDSAIPRPAPGPAAVAPRPATTREVPLARMLGQLVMVRMQGLKADPDVLSRVRRGQIGGVILYGANVRSPAQVRALVAGLQTAARAGGNPPLLISTDQEGGQVARLPWAGPSLTPSELGAAGGPVARQQGIQTGTALRESGVNVNLAPVVDVAHSRQAFIWKQSRAFGLDPRTVSDGAVAFGLGLQSVGVAATAKHFPGVGAAGVDTDFALETVYAEPRDLQPYQAAIPAGISVVMVSTAAYPNLDALRTPAALSHLIVGGLLRGRLHFGGVTMSDDLERPTGYSVAGAVVKAATAGINIILVSTTEGAGTVAYSALLTAARDGRLPVATIKDSYERVMALKRRYAT